MTYKTILFFLVITVIIVVSYLTVLTSRKEDQYKPGLSVEVDQAVNQAKVIYDLNKKQGKDFSNGPCLSNALLPGWVLKIVHNPRTKEDDMSQNQCQAYAQGQSKHIVELDLEGNVVRVK